MTATNPTAPLWSPARRRAFHAFAAAILFGAAGMCAALSLDGLRGRGLDGDVILSAAAGAAFLAAAAATSREARRPWPR